ncbi:hypothetical protein PIB30_052229 [Stylosanthes scabra]|uniref:Uncharacterized protein n=1 Tax=Stylosanthes scabra TaxID=79078 RepID=A0ABU6RI93_9FABA|nr:hypothetical protein [Stylosanthes scabra]
MDETRANFKNREASIRNLEVQVSQIPKQLSERPPNTFPSNTVPNPREECKAIRVIELEEIPEVQVEAPKEKPEVVTEIKNQEGELILRVHEESLILNVYKPMNHHGIRSNLKISTKELTKQDPPDKPLQAQPLYKTVNEDPTPSLNKVEIKRNKSGTAKASYTDKFSQIQIASKAPYQVISVCHNKQKLTTNASPMKIDPP